MAEALSLSVPGKPETHLNIDFLTGECGTLVVLACTVWTPEADRAIRDRFNAATQQGIDALMGYSRFGQHSRMHNFVLGENYRMRKAGDLLQGFGGYSLAAVDNGHTPGTAVPHVIFTNYAGKSGIFIPDFSDDFSGPYSGYCTPERPGLYTVPKSFVKRSDCLADMRTLGFRFESGGKIYAGLKTALRGLVDASAVPTSSSEYGSIVLAQQKDPYRRSSCATV